MLDCRQPLPSWLLAVLKQGKDVEQAHSRNQPEPVFLVLSRVHERKMFKTDRNNVAHLDEQPYATSWNYKAIHIVCLVCFSAFE